MLNYLLHYHATSSTDYSEYYCCNQLRIGPHNWYPEETDVVVVTEKCWNKYCFQIYLQPPPRDTWNGDIKGYYVGYKTAASNEPYNFQLLEVPRGYDKGLSFTILDLREFTKYTVVIQAFNDIGKGPLSSEILVMTGEDGKETWLFVNVAFH